MRILELKRKARHRAGIGTLVCEKHENYPQVILVYDLHYGV